MTPLPRLMVAPNGARLGKADHPEIPISLVEIVSSALACFDAGADGLHLHLRDSCGRHILDSGRYREALAELARAVPGMAVQITTEAAGLYDAAHQRKVALDSGASLVSTSIRELMSGTDTDAAASFFFACAEAEISLQFILYDLADLTLLQTVLPESMFQSPELQVLFVLGRYSASRDSSPADLHPFLTEMRVRDWQPDWGVCAFGKGETACLKLAHEKRGKLRVGFENSLWSVTGEMARDNAQRVREIADMTQRAARLHAAET